MQNPAFYGSWPLNLNQYAWSPEAIQQYQNMLLTDPTLQQQMHQPQTHPPQPLQHTPLATPPATAATSTPPPPPPPPPPSFSPPPAPSSAPHPTPTYSQPTPHPANLPHRTPSTAPTPATWKPDSQHYDSNPLHGNPLFRQIQPTAWSRARNVHGMDPLLLPASFLLRQGQEEYALRLLSAGRYMGLIPTRNIAESVLMSMLLKNMREKNLFIDDMAQSLHERAGQPVPSKKDQAIAYMQPLVDSIVTHLQSIQPPQVKAQQLHQIHQLQAQLAKQTEKLRTHGIPPTPEKPPRRHSKTTRAAAPSAPSHSAPTPQPPTPPSPDYLPETPSPSPALNPSPPAPAAPAETPSLPAQKATTKSAPRKRQASSQPTPPSQSRLPFSKRPRHADPPAPIPEPSPSPSPSAHSGPTDAPNSAAASMPSQPLHIQHPELATVIQPTKPLTPTALPTAYSATKIQKWIAQHNNPELTEHVREITSILAKIPKRDQPNLAETAVRFGLPMAGATSMTYKTLSQFCAAASHLAAWLAHQLYTTQLTTSQHQQLHRDIHTTARCLEHLIHHHPAIDKHHLIFTHGLLHLTCIFHFANTSQRHQQWKQFFLQHHITPDSYTLSRTQQTPAVYIKLPFHHHSHRTYHQTGHYYIGSTNIGLYKREFNRQAKLKQLHDRKTPHVELALRWWLTNHNYHQYSTLFLLSTTTYTQAWAQEHALIQQHRSPLNFPYIQQHLHRTPFAFHIKPNKLHFSRTHTAKRLWRRVRRATRSLHRNQTPTERNIQSWTTLYHLASFNRQRFETSKHLRSLQTGMSTHFGDLHSMWNNPRDPGASQNFAVFSTFETAPFPKGTSPWHFPFSATPLFRHKSNIGFANTSWDTRIWPFHCTLPHTDHGNKLTSPSTASFTTSGNGTTPHYRTYHLANAPTSCSNIHTPNITQATSPPPLTLSPYRHTCNTTNTAMASAQHSPLGNGISNKSQPPSFNGSNTTACQSKTLTTSPTNFTHSYSNNGINTNNTWLDTPSFMFRKSLNSNASSQINSSYTTQTMRQHVPEYFAHTSTFRQPAPHGATQSSSPQSQTHLQKQTTTSFTPFRHGLLRSTNGE